MNRSRSRAKEKGKELEIDSTPLLFHPAGLDDVGYRGGRWRAIARYGRIAPGGHDPPVVRAMWVAGEKMARYARIWALHGMDEAAFWELVMTQYFGFGGKLHHEIPHWVEADALFHIRVRCAVDNSVLLTEPVLAAALLESVRFYEAREIWFPVIFLLMPDHLHAMLGFGRGRTMSGVIGDWKRFCAVKHGVKWQENYFDHRLRGPEQVEEKFHYILNNPVVSGLCDKAEAWPWKLVGGS